MSENTTIVKEQSFHEDFLTFKKLVDKCENIGDFKIPEDIEYNMDNLVTEQCYKYYRKKLSEHMNDWFYVSFNISGEKVNNVGFEMFYLKEDENKKLLDQNLNFELVAKRVLTRDSRLAYFWVTPKHVEEQTIFRVRRYVYLEFKNKTTVVNFLSDQSNVGYLSPNEPVPFDVNLVKASSPKNGFIKPNGEKFDFSKDFCMQKIFVINEHTEKEFLEQQKNK